jgi:hypothetical protein
VTLGELMTEDDGVFSISLISGDVISSITSSGLFVGASVGLLV